MVDLSHDEIVCLSIMHDGTNMLAIGRWKPAIESLAKQGYARQLDAFNYVATAEGKKAAEQQDASQSGEYVRVANEINEVKNESKKLLEDASTALAKACRLEQRLSGQVANQVTFGMGQAIIKRALEILG